MLAVFVSVQQYSIGINILTLLFRYCYFFSKCHCPNNHILLDCFVHKLWLIKCMRERTGCVHQCFFTFISFFLFECQDSFLHHFLSIQRILFIQSAKVDGLATCLFIWESLLHLELLQYTFIRKGLIDDSSLHSVLLPFMASDAKSYIMWLGVSSMEYTLLLLNGYENCPSLSSSVFQYLMVYFCVHHLELHCWSHLAS